MRVFISWSGEPSRLIAELLRSWIPSVIQEVQPFVSSQDIAKGTRGMETIGRQLADTDFGIVVLTPDNASAPWINFEAGALSKSLAHGHVIPLLCGITEIDLPNSPLRQFQWAHFSRQEILSLLVSMNASCDQPLAIERLTRAFEVWWPELSDGYEKLPKMEKAEKPRSGSPGARVENALEAMMADLSALRRETSNNSASILRLTNAVSPSTSTGIAAESRKFDKWIAKSLTNQAKARPPLDVHLDFSNDELIRAILDYNKKDTPPPEGSET